MVSSAPVPVTGDGCDVNVTPLGGLSTESATAPVKTVRGIDTELVAELPWKTATVDGDSTTSMRDAMTLSATRNVASGTPGLEARITIESEAAGTLDGN